jgi:hypothetical protein
LHLVCQCRGPSIFSPRYSFSSSMIFAIKYFSEKAYVTLSLSYSFSSLHMLSFVCFSFCLLTSFHLSLYYSFIVTFILVPSSTSFFTSYFYGSLSTFLLLIFSLSSPSFFKVPSPSWNVPDVEFSPFLIWPHLPLCPFRAHPHFVHTSLRI